MTPGASVSYSIIVSDSGSFSKLPHHRPSVASDCCCGKCSPARPLRVLQVLRVLRLGVHCSTAPAASVVSRKRRLEAEVQLLLAGGEWRSREAE